MMSKTYVDANYRFIAASQEVNARIAQRQQALTLYVSLVVGLLATLVALRPGPGASAASAPPVEWLVLGFPVASLFLALLNYQAERAITNLRTFLSVLERLEDAHNSLPSYNSEPRWSARANSARRLRDIATTLLATGANTLGLLAAWTIYPARAADTQPHFAVAALLSVLSVLALMRSSQWSYRAPDPAASQPDTKNQ